MTLIRKKAELEIPQNIKAMIYGQVGAGKTTLALSSPKPLLLDFDGGIHRVNFGHIGDNVMQIKNWNEVQEVFNYNLSEYETIVVDTIGKMMDFIIEVAENKRIGGWKKWDFINDEFKSFVRKIHAIGKHVIFIAHRDTRSDGDETVFVPALREKNYTAIVTELDLLGYLDVKGTKRTITFNPTSKNDGKNTCNLPELIDIPIVVNAKKEALENNFFTKNIINPYISELQNRAEYQRKYRDICAELSDAIALITDDVSANEFLDRVNSFNHIGNSKDVSRKMLVNKARELGLTLNKEKRYEKPAA